MPVAEYSQIVRAPFPIVWEQLIEKARDPKKFLTICKESELLEEGPGNRVIRRMVVNYGRPVDTVIVEEIVWDEATRLIDFIIIEHPSHSGHVTNQVDTKVAADGTEELWLTFKMDWTFKGQGADPLGPDVIKNGVIGSCAQIEKVASE